MKCWTLVFWNTFLGCEKMKNQKRLENRKATTLLYRGINCQIISHLHPKDNGSWKLIFERKNEKVCQSFLVDYFLLNDIIGIETRKDCVTPLGSFFIQCWAHDKQVLSKVVLQLRSLTQFDEWWSFRLESKNKVQAFSIVPGIR